jgi:hypothetical protein
MPHNFNIRFRNALGPSKNLPRHLTDDLLQRANGDKNLLKMSLPVMRRGFTFMMFKPYHYTHTCCFALPQENTTGAPMSESNAAFFFDPGIVHYELTAEGQTIKILIWWF